jgi:hypothetical protein
MYQTIKRILKLAWSQWKRIAGVIGRFQTRVILTIFYVLIVGPVSLLAKLFRHDPLNRRIDNNAHYWKDHEAQGTDLERARHQF